MYNPNSPNNVPPPISQKLYKEPKELHEAIEKWKHSVLNELIPVQIPKTDMDGNVITMQMPKPATIDGFCRENNITHRTFTNYCSASGYEAYFPVARALMDFCTSVILERGMMNIYPAAMVKFYLINNSRYKDVSEVVHTDNEKKLPSWATGSQVEVKEKTKGIGGESIEFEEVKPDEPAQ